MTRDKRITIQTPGEAQGANGEIDNTWTTFATLWANVRDLSGREYVAASATQNSATTRMQIERTAGILPNYRVAYGSDFYNIEAILESPDNMTQVLVCKRLT